CRIWLLQPVQPRRGYRQRLRVTIAARPPGEHVGTVGGRGVVALAGHNHRSILPAYDKRLMSRSVTWRRHDQDAGSISASPASSSYRVPGGSISSGSV